MSKQIQTNSDTDSVPGLTLQRSLHWGSYVTRMAWSPDGQWLAVPTGGDVHAGVLLQSSEMGEQTKILGAGNRYYCVAWKPDSKYLAAGTNFDQVIIWNIDSGQEIAKISLVNEPYLIAKSGMKYKVRSASWSPDGRLFAFVNSDGCQVRNTTDWSLHRHLEEIRDVTCCVWSPKGDFLAVGSTNDLRIWRIADWSIEQVVKVKIEDITWSPDGTFLVYATDSELGVLRFKEVQTIRVEGHTEQVYQVAFSPDGRILVSGSSDGTFRLWETKNWQLLGIVSTTPISAWVSAAFNPTKPLLATSGTTGYSKVNIWDADFDLLHNARPFTDQRRYYTAKLVLVGDSGVGKTGLGWRLAHGEFKEHSSTHGQQFWIIDGLGQTRTDGTECEAVLWDLAGQPDYRLVHSLFLDDVDTALVLFDPTNRQEPLSGVDFWLNQLKDKEQDLCNSILVGARTDRGTSTLTVEELQVYCERNGICGGYIPTSALKGDGIPELLECLKANIPWNEMTATVTTQTFKHIKEFVLGLKEQTEHKKVLLNPAELRAQLQAADSEWEFSDSEMMTAVGHLATHGYVTVLSGSKGAQSILLAPDLMANLASSIVLEARRNPRGLGVLEESRLLAGDYSFPELHDLDKDERGILLDAAAVLFLEHNLCFRENFNQQTFLVFPSLINEKRPKDADLTPVEGASYRVKGAVENVYASLVVLLGYTNTFIRTHQWQNQAQYEMDEGEICGFQQTSYGEGEIELVLYYAEHTPDPVRLTFRGLFERFLGRRELEISRYQTVLCPKCGSQLARNVVMSQLAKNKDFSFCNECGEKLSLPNPDPLTRLSRREELMLDVQQAVVERRTAFEAALVRVKAILRDRGEAEKPTCFISYAWGIPEHERWVLQLAKDLRKAGINVLLDRWHSPPGSNLDLFIERILSSDFVLPVGTPALRQKYDIQKSDPVVAAELKLINLRVRQPTTYGDTVLPVLLAGEAQTSLSPQLQPLVCVDFREEDSYFRKLFDMIWRIYSLPFDNPLLEELQASMSPRRK